MFVADVLSELLSDCASVTKSRSRATPPYRRQRTPAFCRESSDEQSTVTVTLKEAEKPPDSEGGPAAGGFLRTNICVILCPLSSDTCRIFKRDADFSFPRSSVVNSDRNMNP
ncbi:hypothetical protein F2P81_017679 [Scophthalmus maximus]|uniref:Uncharacterized protein n=1 Tax=Scophthalmus maximus TaxID=52904 RepID=A0A6A4SFE3_SCOMX|nr:hypothetical protein F2P81_017679 [Scophthalmus maximus]